MKIGDKTVVQFDYMNHKGAVTRRTLRPIRVWFGSTGFHPEAQWHLEAFDLDKMATRDYACGRILSPWAFMEIGDAKDTGAS